MTVPSAAALKAWNSRTAEQRIGRFAGDWMEGFDAAIKAMGEPVAWVASEEGNFYGVRWAGKVYELADGTPLVALPKDE